MPVTSVITLIKTHKSATVTVTKSKQLDTLFDIVLRNRWADNKPRAIFYAS